MDDGSSGGNGGGHGGEDSEDDDGLRRLTFPVAQRRRPRPRRGQPAALLPLLLLLLLLLLRTGAAAEVGRAAAKGPRIWTSTSHVRRPHQSDRSAGTIRDRGGGGVGVDKPNGVGDRNSHVGGGSEGGGGGGDARGEHVPLAEASGDKGVRLGEAGWRDRLRRQQARARGEEETGLFQ